MHDTARAHMAAGSFAAANQVRAHADGLALSVHNGPVHHRLDLHGMSVTAAVDQVQVQLGPLQQLAQVGNGAVVL